MGVALTFGVMARYMWVSGSLIKCTVEDSLNGQMENAMRANSKMINDMVMECSYGVMAECMTDSGVMVNSMAGEYLKQQMELNLLENGMMERD